MNGNSPQLDCAAAPAGKSVSIRTSSYSMADKLHGEAIPSNAKKIKEKKLDFLKIV